MQYFGGKARVAKDIVSVLNEYRKPNQLFVEPFRTCTNLSANYLCYVLTTGGLNYVETLIK